MMANNNLFIDNGFLCRNEGYTCFLPQAFADTISRCLVDNTPMQPSMLGYIYGNKRPNIVKVLCDSCKYYIDELGSKQLPDDFIPAGMRYISIHKECYDKLMKEENDKKA